VLGSIRRSLVLLLVAAVGLPCLGQSTAKATLEPSETLFSVLAAINQCGYDQELDQSDPVRGPVRAEIAQAVQAPAAAQALGEMCAFYRDHQLADQGRDLAQYVSLALNLGEPPTFAPKLKAADLPPDASYILGFVPLLQKFYTEAKLHAVWTRHEHQYEAVVERFHDPVTNLLLQTDVYLRMPLSGYVGRHFSIYVEPLAAPGQVNARNYGADYYMVVSPERGTLPLPQIRHTYLHFILDPLALKRANAMLRLQPLLQSVKTAPIGEEYKRDISLLLTECLVRAVEARTMVVPRATPARGAKGRAEDPAKAAEAARLRAVDDAVHEGYILTGYFYEQLVEFEKGEVGLKDAYPDWLYYIDVAKEKKRASEIQFAAKAAPELLQPSNTKPALLAQAEARLAANDPRGAMELAQQALDSKKENAGRALFILGRAASLNRDMKAAQSYFEQTVQVSHEPFFVGRAHIYLGRIFDLQGEREEALKHYRAALEADPSASTKADAERGLKEPFAPPRKDQ
jgi:tetratricopeptide (TPR) repeat protein